MLKLAAGAGLNGAVFGGDDAGGNGLRKRKGAADSLNPVAHLGGVGVAHLDGGQGGAGVDFDDGQIGGLVSADDARRTAEVLGVGIGGELDENLVGFFHDVIVGDDVAPGVDDEAGAEGFLYAAAVIAAIGSAGNLAAEEAVEEVLEVALALALRLLIFIVAVAGILRYGLDAAVEVAAALVIGLLGKGLGVDIHHCRPYQVGNLHKLIGGDGGIDNLEGSGVGARVLLFLPANSVSGKGAGHDSNRERSKQDKR